MLSRSQDSDDLLISSEKAASILKCFLKGFAANTARLMPDGSYRTVVGNQTVAIHPSSGLFGKKVEAIMYNEFVFYQSQLRSGRECGPDGLDWRGVGSLTFISRLVTDRLLSDIFNSINLGRGFVIRMRPVLDISANEAEDDG